MSLRFAVVHEAEADFLTATELADRVLVEAIDWLDEHLLVDQRTWLAETTSGWRLTWKGIKRLALDAGLSPVGHFDDGPGEPDAAAARRALLFLQQEYPDLDAILLIRDQDDQPERRDGLEQARRQYHRGIPIVVGLAVVEREAWVINGFEPDHGNEDEATRLQTERTNLGFDPRLRSHELTAGKDNKAKRSPKRVLEVLCGDDRDRERRCWCETSLDVLRTRGEKNGLAAYLDEVRAQLAPLIGHVPES